MHTSTKGSSQRPALTSLLILPLIAMLSTQAHAGDVRVSNYGAFENDGVDDTSEIQAALDAAQDGDRVLFAPGQYDLFVGSANHPGLLLDSKANIELAGRNTTLMVHSFDIEDPSNSTYGAVLRLKSVDGGFIHGFEIDMSRPAFSCGTVIGNSGGTIDVLFDSEFPVTDQMEVQALLSYTPAGLPYGKGCDYYFTSGPTPQVTYLGSPQQYSIAVGGSPSVNAGDRVTVRHKVYGNNAITLEDSSSTVLDEITVYAAPGMGLLAYGCTDISISRFEVVKKPGTQRLMSTTADGSHLVTNRGDILYSDCVFEGMGDDGINIHGNYQEVTAVASGAGTVTVQQFSNHWYTEYEPGDLVWFFAQSTLAHQGTATVTGVSSLGGGQYQLTVNQVPSSATVGSLATNGSAVPSASISNVTVRHNRARGMLLQTHDVTVTDCLVEGSTGPGIHVTTDSYYWHESVGVNHVTITDCEILGTNKGASQGFAAVSIFAPTGAPPGIQSPASAGTHSEITLLQNRIEDTDRSAVFVGSAADCLVHRNNLKDVSLSPSGGGSSANYAVFIETSDSITVTTNTLSGSSIGGWSSANSTNLTVTGNTGF